MTKEEALHAFFSSFSIPAYPNINVTEEASYPYLTYEIVSGPWDDIAFPTVNIYYKDRGLTAIIDKVNEIGAALENGGTRVQYDGGMLWITQGTPYVNYMQSATDDKVKQAILNINVDIL